MSPPAAPRSSLAEALRAGTRTLHGEVERSALMQALLKGRLSRAGYVGLLRSLAELYRALEGALEAHRGHPAVAALWAPQLRRSAALAADLQVLHGPGWAREVPVEAPAAAYAAHLAGLAPELLVAHLYVRSLGDLNGGQLLARLVAGGVAAGLAGGTAFYDFGGEAEAARLARELRQRLAALELAPAVQAAVVEEARSGFERHRALFEALAARHLQPLTR